MLEWDLPGFKHYAGQYAWISVPNISHMEWCGRLKGIASCCGTHVGPDVLAWRCRHPFTISSHPSANVHTFHIKVGVRDTAFLVGAPFLCGPGTRGSGCVMQAMGNATWTEKLAREAEAHPGMSTGRISRP